MQTVHHERTAVKALFRALLDAPIKQFPNRGEKLDAPSTQGVYIIYNPQGEVLHVGRTPSGAGGVRQRLSNHLHAASSFTNKFLKGDGSKLRGGYRFQCLVVEDRRLRALLEAYAIGCLCPAHIGLSERASLVT